MFKSIKVTEEVYSMLKALAVEEKKSLSNVILATCSTSGRTPTLENRVSTLESEIAELKSSLLLNEGPKLHKIKKQRAEGEIRTRVVAST
ncbi:MAG: hypothetical protein ACXV7G_13300, partial [Halobacteriota archaeon]